MASLPHFAELAAEPDPRLDLLALALAAEFRSVDSAAALAALDDLGEEIVRAVRPGIGSPRALIDACGRQLGHHDGFTGDRRHYDAPDNSMLDVVLVRRRGLPILLSVVYIEAARRADIPLAGVGLAGHFVVGHFGSDPPALIDPFHDGDPLDAPAGERAVRPWRPHQIAWRMLNNLAAGYERRGDLGAAIRAAEMRLLLPAADARRDLMHAELQALRARLN